MSAFRQQFLFNPANNIRCKNVLPTSPLSYENILNIPLMLKEYVFFNCLAMTKYYMNDSQNVGF